MKTRRKYCSKQTNKKKKNPVTIQWRREIKKIWGEKGKQEWIGKRWNRKIEEWKQEEKQSLQETKNKKIP